jgi:hypothetical protein
LVNFADGNKTSNNMWRDKNIREAKIVRVECSGASVRDGNVLPIANKYARRNMP